MGRSLSSSPPSSAHKQPNCSPRSKCTKVTVGISTFGPSGPRWVQICPKPRLPPEHSSGPSLSAKRTQKNGKIPTANAAEEAGKAHAVELTLPPENVLTRLVSQLRLATFFRCAHGIKDFTH